MSETWLTPDEVEQLTGRKRWSAQCRALAGMGMKFLPNAMGRPLVERAQVLAPTPKKRAPQEPNWAAYDSMREESRRREEARRLARGRKL